MTLAEHAREYVDMEPHLHTLQQFAKDARLIIELGTRTGVSTWAFLDGMGNGSLYSVDLERDVLIPDRVASDHRWHFVKGDDRQPSTWAQMPPNPDLIFIDTSHEYHHTLEELVRSAAFGAQIIALHDYNKPDVQDAVHGFCRRSRWQIIGMEPSEWGLAWIAQS